MSRRLRVAPEVGQALAEGTPVVALESALITHGFPPPVNLDIAVFLVANLGSRYFN